jgi:hypothetical protein
MMRDMRAAIGRGNITLRLASLGDWSGCAGAAVAAVADESP